MTTPDGSADPEAGGGADPRAGGDAPGGIGGVAAEAAVGLPGVPVPEIRRRRDEELAAAGWSRRFTGSPPRLGELTELYEATGKDVLLDDVFPGELAVECEGCQLALALFKVIYTRVRPAPHHGRNA